MAIINGDNYSNPNLVGTGSDDIIDGKGGDDIINGGAGNDRLIGGTGNDTLTGGVGNDIFAYSLRSIGRDTITDFQRGVDRIDVSALNIGDFTTLSRFISYDAAGNAVITFGFDGGSESITLKGIYGDKLGAANFIFNGNAGALQVDGTNYRDVLFGGNGSDALTGYSGDDTLSGGAGNDRLLGMNGDDTLIGGAGNDIYVYSARGFGRDTIEGFGVAANTDNTDKIDLSALNVADFATLSRFITSNSVGDAVITLGFDGSPESITLKNIKTTLSAANFIFNTNAAALTVDGTNYRDVLFGGNGHDALTGYSGDDTLSGGAGNDRLLGMNGDDTLIGGAGNDIYVYAARSFGRDTIEGFSAAANTDKIDLSALNVADFATLSRFITRNSVGDAVITLGFDGSPESITLKNIKTTLSAANFIFNTNAAALTIDGTNYRDVLFGGNGHDALTGYSGDDMLTGGAGNDRLLGMNGDDTLIGGAGNDTYVYSARGFGRDTIEGFSAAANTDKIDLSALNVADFTTLSRFITTNSAGDAVITLGFDGSPESITLKGVKTTQLSAANFIFNTNSAALTVEGTGYFDVLFGGNGHDTLTGYSSNDTLTAGAGNDRLIGMTGDDTLIGGIGADRMEGGAGNDIYYVDNAGDQVIEASGQGTDIVYAMASYALAAGQYVETLSTTSVAGTTAINLTGNEFDQRISGNNGNNVLNGGGGNDILVGYGGADTMIGGAGNDIFYVDNARDAVVEAAGGGADSVLTSVSYALAAGRHIETLGTISVAGTAAINLTGNELAQRINGNNGANGINGGGGNDTLYGFGGNDTLNGGTGIDLLAGGLGNDRFYVDNAADRVVETASQGSDTVYASVSYTLAAGLHVETLATTALTGTSTINLTGNELAQTIIGNNGANALNGAGGNDALYGNSGNDVLAGGVGNDTLTGGVGNDYFVFNTALNPSTNVDRIADFSVPHDTIRLDNAVMAGLGATLGTLSAGKFWKSTAGVAHDADDRIIYDIDNGRLFYDANGSAAGGAVHFATLAPNLALTNVDFIVF